MRYKGNWSLGAVALVAACSKVTPTESTRPDSVATSAALPLAPCGANDTTAAPTILNGGFEDPALPDPAYLTVAANAAPEKFGWAVLGDGVDVCRAGWASGGTTVRGEAFEGQQYLDLVGYGSTGKIAQWVAAVPGKEHTLRFVYANNPLSTRNAAARVTVNACGERLISKTFNHDNSTAEDLHWTVFEASFVPKTSSVTVEIESTYAEGSGGILLDAIELSHGGAAVSSVEQPPTPAARVEP